MVDRLFMGMMGSNALMRITPPGYNATDLSSPAVISSDNDYMRVHQRSPSDGVNMETVITGGGSAFYYYGYYTSFPDLGYLPLVYYGLCMSDVNNRIFFPHDNALTEGFPPLRAMVSTNGFWVYFQGRYIPQSFKLKYIIFENPLQ